MEITQEQELIVATAREFAQDKLIPFAAEWDRQSLFPKDAVMELGALGFLGMLVPEKWGGADTGYVAYALAMIEIAKGDSVVSLVMSIQNSLACAPIAQFGTEEQKEKFLKPLASGKKLGGFALTEPHAGSDASAIKTRAVKTNEGWRITGSKQFISGGKTADYIVVFAVTDPGAGKRGISAFIVPTNTPGYTVARVEDKLGLRGSDTCHLVFDEMLVPHENMLGDEGEGYKIALSNLEGGRIGIAAQSLGIAEAAYGYALRYARERQSMGQALIKHQSIAFKLAEMATKLQAARLMILEAARIKDSGKACLKEAAMAKLYASEVSEAICSAAIQIHGGYGYLQDFPVERLYRDVRVCQIYEGTNEIQKLLIAREIEKE